MGCPIRILKAHRLDAAPLERFVGLHVLLRPDAPRHPPRTLSRLCVLPTWGRTRASIFPGASVALLFALGKIEVIIWYRCSVVQGTSLALRCRAHQLECGKPPERGWYNHQDL